jgi:hypothetical protein
MTKTHFLAKAALLMSIFCAVSPSVRAGEKPQVSDDSAAGKAAADAIGEVLKALGAGNGGSKPADPQQLKALLPETAAGLPRTTLETKGISALGVAASSVHAEYGKAGQRLQIEITDAGSLGALVSAASWMGITLDKEADGRVEKVYSEGGRMVREEYATDKSHAEYNMALANGVMVVATGEHLGIDAVRDVVKALDLEKIEKSKSEKPNPDHGEKL